MQISAVAIDPHDNVVLWTALDDLCDKLQWSSVGARRYYQLSWSTTAQFITLWASTFLELSPEFAAKFKSEVTLFLKIPEFPYNIV